MSLAAICSGNFHQLRSRFGSTCSFKLLGFHNGLGSGRLVDARRCNLRPLSRNVERKNHTSQSSKTHCINWNLHGGTVKSSASLDINKSELHEFKSVQHYKLQQISDRVFDWPATIIVIDIETTGLKIQKERIIEIACRDLTGGERSTLQTLVNPGIDVMNSYIHGIRTDMVNRPDVPRFDEFIPILLQYVSSRQMDGKPVVFIAHNGRRFDVPFIIAEFQRCSMEVPEDWLFVDTLPLARQLVKADGSKLPSFSLKSLRNHYGIPLVGPAHRAMQDVMTLSYVLQRITFDLKLTVPELMDRAFKASDLKKVSL